MARTAPRIVAVGDAIVDLVTPPIPPIPRGDHQGHVARLDALPGGNATNFALQIASLGASTTFVGIVGRDPNANVLRAAYRHAGVRSILRTDPLRSTGATLALTWKGGGRALITSLGANAGLRMSDIPRRVFDRLDHLHRAGYWWTPRLIGRPTTTLLGRARRSGASTSLDVSTDPAGWTRSHVRGVRESLREVDTFFGNEVEVCAIAGVSGAITAAQKICTLGAGEVVVHRGPRGSVGVTRSGVVRAPAYPVPVDNPTGCGDVFNAAYVFARLRGDDIPDALRFANACAALHMKDRHRPYPSLADVRRFLRG